MPHDAAFHHRVIAAALALLDETQGPVLSDYEEDVPASESDEASGGWACPVSFPAQIDESTLGRLRVELRTLAPWYEHALSRRKRTTSSVTGLGIEATAQSLVEFIEQDVAPSEDDSLANALRLRCEDLKSFYLEAATAQPGENPLAAVNGWFWTETEASGVLRQLAMKCREHADPNVRLFGQAMLIPRQYAET